MAHVSIQEQLITKAMNKGSDAKFKKQLPKKSVISASNYYEVQKHFKFKFPKTINAIPIISIYDLCVFLWICRNKRNEKRLQKGYYSILF